jgi:hypothetical protein
LLLARITKKARLCSQGIQTAEVDVATIHDVEGARFDKQLVEDIEIVYVSSRDVDKARDTAPQVHQGVHFDCTLASAKSRPGKERKTQIDGRRIEGVGRLLQCQAKVVFGIPFSGHADEHLGEVGVDSPVSCLVGVGQGTSGDFASDADMIEFRLYGAKTSFDVAQAFPVGKLCESHTAELI